MKKITSSKFVRLLFPAIFLFFSALNSVAAVTSSNKNLMGINLRWGYSDWNEDRMFADVMKMCRAYGAPGHNGGASSFPATVNANGWPTQDFEVVVWAGISNMHGTYRLSFDCANTNPTVAIGWMAGTLSNKQVNGSTVSYDLTVPGTGSSSFLLTITNTNGGAQNIKMMRPETPGSTISYDAGTVFTNQIKNLTGKFQVIRFMDYFATNSNNLTTWSQRSLPTDAAQGQRLLGSKTVGGCYEYAIQLCNETGRDFWLDIPLKVDDDFITKLAQLIKYGSDGVNPYTSTQINPIYPPLNSTLKLYIEYSNEVWNTAPAFQQGNDNHTLAVAEVNAGNSPLNFGGQTNDWVWAWRRVGKKIVEISNTFRSINGDADMMTRIRPVLMGQQGSGPTNPLTLIDQIYGKVTQWCSNPHPVNYYIYGCGGSGYYNPDNSSINLTIDNIWTSQSMDINNWIPTCRKESAIAHAFGLKRICYEGGPSFDNSGHSEATKAQTVNDARMKTDMINHFDNAWSATDGDLFVYYVSTGDYQWGFTPDIYNLNTPKLQAIDQLNSQNKADASICSVPPVVINGTSNESNWAISTYGWTNGTALHVKQNAYVIYMFRVATAGTYNLSANLNTNTGPLSILCDGANVGPDTQAKGNLPTYTLSNLQPGLHAILFKTTTGEVEIATVTINSGAGTITDIENIANEEQSISVYPNPAINLVNVSFTSKNENTAIVRIVDIAGKELINYAKPVLNGINNLTIDVNGLKSGIYFINVITRDKTILKKLFINR